MEESIPHGIAFTLKSPPTVETSKRLQEAFDLFNDNLFDGVGSLTPCSALNASKMPMASTVPARYSDTQRAAPSPAIALNSTNANERELHLLLSTLVHEMCHQYTSTSSTNEGKATGGGHGV